MVVENQTVVLNTSTIVDTNAKSGMKINMNGNFNILSVLKDAASTATTAYILNASKTIIATSGIFVGNIATFAPFLMNDGVDYYITVDREGTGFNHRFNQIGISYPYAGTVLDWIGGLSSVGADTAVQVWSIDSVTFGEDATDYIIGESVF